VVKALPVKVCRVIPKTLKMVFIVVFLLVKCSAFKSYAEDKERVTAMARYNKPQQL